MRFEQRGHAVISEVRADGADGFLPYLHGFTPSPIEAAEIETRARELPERLRINLRTVNATLLIDAYAAMPQS